MRALENKVFFFSDSQLLMMNRNAWTIFTSHMLQAWSE